MGALERVIIAINLFSFFITGYDKNRAKKGLWRVPEKNLFILSTLFGALGVLLGMKVFHHKTKKWVFKVGIPVLLMLNLLCYYYIKILWKV